MYSDRRSSSERRPGSGYGEPIQLPPPPPGDGSRKMSSPTLEQYQISPRSPEQRRGSNMSPLQANFTLPPIQGFTQAQAEPSRRASFTQHRDLARYPVQSDASDAFTSDHHPTMHRQNSYEKKVVPQEPTPSQAVIPSSPATLNVNTSVAEASQEAIASSPAAVKLEKMPTPQPLSAVDAQPVDESDNQTVKTVAALKNEYGLRAPSAALEPSAPAPNTEASTPEQPPTMLKKRSAPAKTKKGTATTMKKAPAVKRRKVEPNRSMTPSHASELSIGKSANGKSTPVNSSPGPSTRSDSAEPNDEPYDDEDDDDEEMDDDPNTDVYCICRKPDNGTFMIGCDGTCDDWFHGKCVGVEERDKNLIDKYICPTCTKAGVGRTTWKRMCRRSGCRQPAKTSKTKGGNNGSKYCSDECGVLFFRDMASKTRGREENAKNRASRRKASVAGPEKSSVDHDLGAKGGVLSAGEVKAMLNASKTAEDFRKLGDGVLSPPATPDSSERPEKSGEFSEAETQALEKIHTQKEAARNRHALLKDRLTFVTMVKQAASRLATEKDLKPKDFCGYDSRLEWTEDRFREWRSSKTGLQAFELETLATENSGQQDDKDMTDDNDDEDLEICDRKKCQRHLEWSKLAVDDLRFEMSDNSDRMRALDREEKEIKSRAALRAKMGKLNGEGTVEVHDVGIVAEPSGDRMDVDTSPDQQRQPGAEVTETSEAVAANTE